MLNALVSVHTSLHFGMALVFVARRARGNTITAWVASVLDGECATSRIIPIVSVPDACNRRQVHFKVHVADQITSSGQNDIADASERDVARERLLHELGTEVRVSLRLTPEECYCGVCVKVDVATALRDQTQDTAT